MANASDLQPLTLVFILLLGGTAVFSAAVTLWEGYDDNLLQRLGSAIVCISAVSICIQLIYGHPSVRPMYGLALGGFAIVLGTVVKRRRLS